MRNVLLTIIILICLGVFAVCAYMLIDYFYTNMEADRAFDEQRNMVAEESAFEKRLPKYLEMKETNEDFVGWIKADGTHINNPLVQSIDDPNFYLHKDFHKNDSNSGTLFISNVSSLVEPTDVVTVFGHHMRDKTMFGSLENFEEPEFLEEHGRIWIDSLEGRREFQVTNVMRIRVNVQGQDDAFPYYEYSNFEDEADFDWFMEQSDSHTLFPTGETVEYGDKLVLLSTCEYTYGDGSGRLVVMGKEMFPPDLTDMGEATITKPMMGTYVILGIAAATLLILLSLLLSLIKRLRRNKK